MASFGTFIKLEREKKGWSQTEFGALVHINMTAISRIENDKKKFNDSKLGLLAQLFEMDITKVKDLYFADKFAKEAYKHNCSGSVFAVAEKENQYLKSKRIKQSIINF
jgi:transcriptional regulator with XRE-family HTH domain